LLGNSFDVMHDKRRLYKILIRIEPMIFHLRIIIFIVLLFSLMSVFQASGLSIAVAADRKPALEKAIDLKGCPVTLLKNRAYFHALSEKIRDAGKQIVMAFFLFKTNGHPDSYPEIILRELSKAAQRGIQVVLVLEQDGKSDSTINRDNRDSSERLKKAGVEIHFDSPKKTTHTKLAVIDGRFTFIGSHNLTQSALKYNNELSVLIDSPVVSEKTLNYISSLY
jgi:phosphatidylserine/phosphatidylglycerophosphate/cardiolipin synthase-like enzyme